jgi:hypothetical protein
MLIWILTLGFILTLSFMTWRVASRRSRRAKAEPGTPFQTAAPGDSPRSRAYRRPRIRRLGVHDRERFIVAWRSTSSRFVDDPSQAISEADRLLADIMEARGFPVLDFDAAAVELGADHPDLFQHYRPARRIARQNDAGTAGTDALHKGMTHFKAILDELLEIGRRPSLSGL